jgi:hypothetical protein
MALKARRGRILLVDRDFQLRFTRAALGIAVVSTILTGFTLLYPLFFFGILRIPRFLPIPVLFAVSGALILNVVAIAFLALVMTQRVAGPVYSMVRHLRELGAGLFGSELKLRQGDELGYLARNIYDLRMQLLNMTHGDLALVDQALAALPPEGELEELIVLRERLLQRLSEATRP